MSTETATELATISDSSVGDLMMNAPLLAELDKMATRMASAKATIPDHLRGSEGDCWAICMQAIQWRMNPYAVAQKTHLVNGTLGYEAQLVNAVITTMAPTRDRINYEWFGEWERILGKFKVCPGKNGGEYRKPDWKPEEEEGLGVRVWATMKGEDKPRVLELLLTQAQVRNSTMWAADPRQQLAYLAVKRWARLHCPDVILGVYTPDELAEMPAEAEREVGPSKPSRVSSLKEKLSSRKQGEVIEGKADPVPEKPALTFADVAAAINQAETLEALSVIGNNQVPDFLHEGDNGQYREELMAVYKYRQGQLKGDEAKPGK